MNCQKNLKYLWRKSLHMLHKVRNETCSGQEPQFFYRRAQMTHRKLFHSAKQQWQCDLESFSTNLPSNAGRPSSTGCSSPRRRCGVIPHRPLFPRFAKDSYTASIAIGSNYAKSQQFPWAFFQHAVHCSGQLQPGRRGTLVALVAWTGCWMATSRTKERAVSQNTYACRYGQASPSSVANARCSEVLQKASIFLAFIVFVLKAKCYKTGKSMEGYRRRTLIISNFSPHIHFLKTIKQNQLLYN